MNLPPLYLHHTHREQMINHATACLPEEACGLVAGSHGVSQKIFIIQNILHSSFRFKMDPPELLSALEEIDRHDWVVLAIFHSHPGGVPYPSQTDLEELNYPNASILIWAPSQLLPGAWEARSYRFCGESVIPQQILFSPAE